MKLRIEPSVIVITPTVGSPTLVRAVDSVKAQDYKNLKHLVVADGREYFQKVLNLPLPVEGGNRLTITSAPFNTGRGQDNVQGFYGHRIFAAYPHLVNEDYILFLDDDNWWESNHVSSLVDLCEKENLDFSHSFRKVYDKDEFLAEDNCESIGRWPVVWFPDDQKQYLVDSSSYCFKRSWLIQVSQLWHSGWGGDRRFFMTIKDIAKYNTTGLHTLNYSLPDMDKAYGGQVDIFQKGNEMMKQKYNGSYPWLKT